MSRPLDTHISDMLVKVGDKTIVGGGGRGRGLGWEAQPVRGPEGGAEGGGGEGGVDFRVLGEGRKGNEVGVRGRELGAGDQEGVGGEGRGGAAGTRGAGGCMVMVVEGWGRGEVMGERVERLVLQVGGWGVEVGGCCWGDVEVDAAAPDVVCL
jgi:hypothetical protein